MSKFTDIVKAVAAYVDPAYAKKLANDKEIARYVDAKLARSELEQFIFDSENVFADGDRQACHKQASYFERDDVAIKADLATIRAVDTYTADRLASSLDNVRNNLISKTLFGMNWWQAMDAGHTVPDRLPPLAAPTLPKASAPKL